MFDNTQLDEGRVFIYHGAAPGPCSDGDGDGYGDPPNQVCEGHLRADCADTAAQVYPGAPQICDGLNNDCDQSNWPALTGTNEVDGDGDGLTECDGDNCPETANAGQEDFDADGMGDACETGPFLADADNSGRVDGFDLARLARAFASQTGDANYSPDVDLTRDGRVDGLDLAILADNFGQNAS